MAAPRRGADERDHSGLEQQRPRHPARRPAAGEQQADLAEPPFDAQPVEQRQQDERGDQQEEGEIEEIGPEIGRAARGFEPLLPHRDRRQPEILGRQRGEQGLAERAALRGVEADRGGAALPHRPEAAGGFETEKRLGQRAVLLPVAFVPLPDPGQVHGERRIPVAHARRIAHPRELRRERRVREQAVGGDRRSGPEGSRPRAEAPVLLPDQKREFHGVPRGEGQLLPKPLSGEQEIVPGGGKTLRGKARDERVRDLPSAGADGGGEVGQDRRRADPEALGGLEGGGDDRVGQHQAAAFEDEPAGARFAEGESAVVE